MDPEPQSSSSSSSSSWLKYAQVDESLPPEKKKTLKNKWRNGEGGAFHDKAMWKVGYAKCKPPKKSNRNSDSSEGAWWAVVKLFSY